MAVLSAAPFRSSPRAVPADHVFVGHVSGRKTPASLGTTCRGAILGRPTEQPAVLQETYAYTMGCLWCGRGASTRRRTEALQRDAAAQRAATTGRVAGA